MPLGVNPLSMGLPAASGLPAGRVMMMYSVSLGSQEEPTGSSTHLLYPRVALYFIAGLLPLGGWSYPSDLFGGESRRINGLLENGWSSLKKLSASQNREALPSLNGDPR